MLPIIRLNVPIGYSGAPYADQADRQRSEPVSAMLPFVSSARNISTPRSVIIDDSQYCYSSPDISSTSPTLITRSRKSQDSRVDKLPFEIRLDIANRLSQHDAVSLLRVNKAFFKSTIVRLYHTVIVDPSFSHFNLDVFDNECGRFVDVHTASIIKLKYSLKNFLKVIGQDIPIPVPEFGSHSRIYSSLVHKFQFIELPDGFYTPYDLNLFTFLSVKQLDHLSKFYWESERELSFEVVNKLPNKSHLSALRLNLDFKRISHPSEFEAFKGFHNLQKLSIEPFLNAFNLFQIFKNLLEGNNDHLNLRVLRLSRLNSNHGFLKNPSTSLLVLTKYIIESDRIKISDYELNCILNLFILFSASDSRLEELKALVLDSMVVTTADAKRLGAITNLEGLQHLELSNITEVQLPEDIAVPLSLNELYTRLDGGFLKSFGKKLKGLKKLTIDYRESLRDTVPAFIQSLEGLEELDITIRWNVTKLCSVPSWKQLCHQYTNAILKHAHTLRKLSLDTKEDSVFSDLHKLIFTECLMELSALTELRALRLHGYSLQPCAPILVCQLPQLRYLELFGSGAGGAPHMGLQVLHDGVLDDWLRVQHVALAINDKNRDIKFIKIDKCLFEITGHGSVVPRDGLESWFASKVRVRLHSDDFS